MHVILERDSGEVECDEGQEEAELDLGAQGLLLGGHCRHVVLQARVQGEEGEGRQEEAHDGCRASDRCVLSKIVLRLPCNGKSSLVVKSINISLSSRKSCTPTRN